MKDVQIGFTDGNNYLYASSVDSGATSND